MALSEAMLQQIIVGYMNTEHKDILMWSSLNGVNLTGKADKYGEIKSLKKQGLVSGVPDLYIAMSNGKSLHIELKTQVGRLSKKQIDIHKRLKDLGHLVYVVRSLDEFKQVIKDNL